VPLHSERTDYSTSPLEFLVNPLQPVGGSNLLPMLFWESPVIPDVLTESVNLYQPTLNISSA